MTKCLSGWLHRRWPYFQNVNSLMFILVSAFSRSSADGNCLRLLLQSRPPSSSIWRRTPLLSRDGQPPARDSPHPAADVQKASIDRVQPEQTSASHRAFFAMASEYTCNRCLQVLGRGIRAQASLIRPRCFPASRRGFKSSIFPVARDPGSNLRSGPQSRDSQVQSTRAASSSAAQNAWNSNTRPKVNSSSASTSDQSQGTRVLLKPNNLFHPFSKSPAPAIRQRAAFIRQNAFCPHPSHQQTRLPTSPHDPEARKSPTGSLPPAHSHFECPDCGIPVYCSEEHWMDDFEAHLEICDTLRQINEDDHDLHSGRFFPEFTYPGPQDDNFVINMTNWDTFLYTREFEAINHDRSMRQVTRMLTYPVTIASVLHELSPYNIRKGGRLTVEGLKSMSG